MDVLLFDFSGTGHTTMCGDAIASHFIELGHHVDHFTYKSDKEINVDFEKYDLVGFGYPIHAFNVPEAFVRYIKTLPNVNHKKYFIYKYVESISHDLKCYTH